MAWQQGWAQMTPAVINTIRRAIGGVRISSGRKRKSKGRGMRRAGGRKKTRVARRARGGASRSIRKVARMVKGSRAARAWMKKIRGLRK